MNTCFMFRDSSLAFTDSVLWAANVSKRHRAVLPSGETLLMYGFITLSMYASIVDSVDQWFWLQVMCQASGNLKDGKHLSVVPLYMIWGGSSSPAMFTASTPVISRLSSIPTTPTCLDPFLASVHWLDGMILSPKSLKTSIILQARNCWGNWWVWY